MALAKYEKALSSFSEALSRTEQLGDRDHRVTLLGNIGLAYEETGRLKEAASSYESALEEALSVGVSRKTALAAANAAQSATTLADYERAAELVALARQAASSCGLPQLASLIELTAADLMLAQEELEAAVTQIEIGLSGGRGSRSGIDNHAKSVRLRLHRMLLVDGPECLAEAIEELGSLDESMGRSRPVDRLEVRAFLAWSQHKFLGGVDAPAAVVQHAREVGQVGVFGILTAVGSSPTEFLPTLRELGPIQLMERLLHPGARTNGSQSASAS